MGIFEKVGSIPEMIKLKNSLFVLPFAYIGMLYAGVPTLMQFAFITIALLSARATAFAANRYLGRKYDIENPLKQNWASVSLYSGRELIMMFLIFGAIFVVSAYVLNFLAFVLSPLIIVIMILEPLTKRYTAHRHMIMGAVIGLGILGAYIGMTGFFPTAWPLYVLLLGYMCFSASNDVIYTLGHVDFDRQAGLKTYPVAYGKEKAKQIAFFLHMWSAALFAYFGLLILSAPVIIGSIIAMYIFIIEQKVLTANPKAIVVSFFNYNVAVSLLMLATYMSYLAIVA